MSDDKASDDKASDDKVFCVPSKDPRMEYLRDIHRAPEFLHPAIEHFFSEHLNEYKDLEPDKSVERSTRVGRAAAEEKITVSAACRGGGIGGVL